jgi:hypothetical protein
MVDVAWTADARARAMADVANLFVLIMFMLREADGCRPGCLPRVGRKSARTTGGAILAFSPGKKNT